MLKSTEKILFSLGFLNKWELTSQGLTKCQMTFLHLGQHIKGTREYHTQSQTHTHTRTNTHTCWLDCRGYPSTAANACVLADTGTSALYASHMLTSRWSLSEVWWFHQCFTESRQTYYRDVMEFIKSLIDFKRNCIFKYR